MNNASQYLAFLRFCLHDEPCPAGAWDGMDWTGLHGFAQKQSLLGVVFRGVCRAGEAGARPPRELMMQWLAESEQIRRRNMLLNEVAVELSHRFAHDGFRSCILKGQGNALMYPDPYSRTPGDIDIWLEGGRRKVLDYVRKSDPKANLQYHHVDYPPVRGVGVEVHFMPSFFSNPFQNRRMQDYFRQFADGQFRHTVTLPDTEGTVCVPTDSFNLVFQMTHIMRHLFDEGIGLRQLMDYYYLLKKGHTPQVREEAAKRIGHVGMTRFARGLMYVLQSVFALEDECLLTPPDGQLGKVILGEVLRGGNFGRHDDRLSPDSESGIGFTMSVMRRLPGLFRYFPMECLFRPLFLAWYPIWKLRYR